MKILITGGAGFVGSHLVKRLERDQLGFVSVYDNFSRGSIEGLAGNRDVVRVVEGDILDGALLQGEMADTAIVFHLAAISTVFDCERDPEGAFRTNVEGTRHVLSAARDAGVRRVVFTSSREVYGDPERLPVVETAAIMPKNAYGATKAAAEGICREFCDSGLEVSVLRLSNVYGIGDRGRVIPEFVKQALLGAPLTVYGREKLVDFVWIENALDVLVQAAIDPGPCQPVNLGSGKGIRVYDLARRICNLTGEKSTIEVVNQREPEVGSFVADVTAVRKCFGLSCPVDPLEHLPLVVRSFEGGSGAVEGDRGC